MITRILSFSPIPNAIPLTPEISHLLSCYKFCYNSKGVYTNLSPIVKRKMNGCNLFYRPGLLYYTIDGAVRFAPGSIASNIPFYHWPTMRIYQCLLVVGAVAKSIVVFRGIAEGSQQDNYLY